jgi:hypothetical protein
VFFACFSSDLKNSYLTRKNGMKLKNILASICLLALSSTASAGIITKSFEAEINNVFRTSVVSVGDTFSWSVTYDDSSTVSTWFLNGPDGLANTADDTVDFTQDCTLSPTCEFRGDIEFTIIGLLPELYAEMIGNGEAYRSTSSQNYSHLYSNIYGADYYKLLTDKVSLEFNVFSNSAYGSFRFLSSTQPYIGFNNIREVTGQVSVPEPSSLAILGLGLLGLVRFRKKA